MPQITLKEYCPIYHAIKQMFIPRKLWKREKPGGYINFDETTNICFVVIFKYTFLVPEVKTGKKFAWYQIYRGFHSVNFVAGIYPFRLKDIPKNTFNY